MTSIRTYMLTAIFALCLLTGCQGVDFGQITNLFDRDRINNEQAEEHYGVGRELLARGDRQAALEELERALEANPEHVEAITTIGDIYRNSGDYDMARKTYIKACKTKEGRYAFRPHYNLGVTYQALAELAKTAAQAKDFLMEAVATYLRAVTIEPGSFDAHMNLGACYYQLGKYNLASDWTNKAVTIDPKNYRAHNNLGVIAETSGEFDKAITHYKNSIEIKTRQPDILVSLAAIYIKQNKFSSALATLKTAVRVAPDNTHVYQQIGICYFRMKKLDESIQAFQESIRRDPDNPSAYRGYGVVCMYQYMVDPARADLHKLAIKAWQQSVKIDPSQEDLIKLIDQYGKLETASN